MGGSKCKKIPLCFSFNSSVFSVSRLVDFLKKYMNNFGQNEFIWDIVKLHKISHCSADIERSGSTQHYSAELFENLHKSVSNPN